MDNHRHVLVRLRPCPLDKTRCPLNPEDIKIRNKRLTRISGDVSAEWAKTEAAS